jgi:hypothetical protein
MSNTLSSYFLAGTLGVLLQILAVKIPSIKARYKVANREFTFKQYLTDDWYTILASFVSVGILIVGLDEILGLRPELEKYIKWLFVFVGFTGSSIIQTVLSVANKKVMSIIDVKTNIADGIIPPVTEGNIEGAKEMMKDPTVTNETN